MLLSLWPIDAIQSYNSTGNGYLAMNDEADDPGLAGIFATYPAPWLSVGGGLGDQVFTTVLTTYSTFHFNSNNLGEMT